jgi:hypothetical protein
VLRLVVYDRTDTAPVAVPRIARDPDGTARGTGGLSRWWRLGAAGHRIRGRARATTGASSWKEALGWAVAQAEARGAPIDELQAWGHGGWGYMGMGTSRLNSQALTGGLRAEVDALAEVLAPGALVWLRCCSAFGHHGRHFAERLAERLRARVAGHTYIIGIWQSGTHSLAPGETPSWPAEEGVELSTGTPQTPRGARVSAPAEPRTVSFLRGGLPSGW